MATKWVTGCRKSFSRSNPRRDRAYCSALPHPPQCPSVRSSPISGRDCRSAKREIGLPACGECQESVVVNLLVAQCAGAGSQLQVRYPSDILHEPLIGHPPAYGNRREIPPLMVCGEPGRSVCSEIGGNHVPRIKHVRCRTEEGEKYPF